MISVIIPFYNEKESLPLLLAELKETLKKIKETAEVILVDDGSTDNWHQKLPSTGSRIRFNVFSHRKRFGKGRALLTGCKESKGNTIVFMDADLQNDPQELQRFLSVLRKGFDLVVGWRKERKDPISKRLPSFIFNNILLNFFFRSKFHDINCGYKALRREVLNEIPLYGDNYRFLPIMADQAGFKTTELVIKHKPRRFGKSKYGFLRLLSGLFDTLTTYFVYRFADKPLHFFGPIGGMFFIIGFVVTTNLTIGRIFYHHQLYRRPLLLFGILLIIVGIQVIMTGIIAELFVYLRKKNS